MKAGELAPVAPDCCMTPGIRPYALVPHTLPRGNLLLLFARMVFHEMRVALYHGLHQAKTSPVVHALSTEKIRGEDPPRRHFL